MPKKSTTKTTTKTTTKDPWSRSTKKAGNGKKTTTPPRLAAAAEKRLEAVRYLGEAIGRLAATKGAQGIHQRHAAGEIVAACIELGPEFCQEVRVTLEAEAALNGQ